jgi:hypothetical protein
VHTPSAICGPHAPRRLTQMPLVAPGGSGGGPHCPPLHWRPLWACGRLHYEFSSTAPRVGRRRIGAHLRDRECPPLGPGDREGVRAKLVLELRYRLLHSGALGRRPYDYHHPRPLTCSTWKYVCRTAHKLLLAVEGRTVTIGAMAPVRGEKLGSHRPT